jgi:hypothetical protein
VDAVQCAVAVQNEFKARNSELSENRRMEFRIGVNLGDVIEEESRLYGDGVNIAARLEALADPGGICISKTAFDHIESKLPLGYEYLGEQTVKNITKPVGAYRVLLQPRVTVAKAARKKAPSGKFRFSLAIAVILVLLVGAWALWQFFLKPSPPSEDKAGPKKIESELLAQIEAQKQAAEETLRRATEERDRIEQDRMLLEAERRASYKAKKQEVDEASHRTQEEQSRLDQERKQLEKEKSALEAVNQQTEVSRRVASYDGTYSGQCCNQIPNKAPSCWPVALVVHNGIAEGSWISRVKKRARAYGTVAADGSLQLNLVGWTQSGTPVKAILTGRVADAAITATGEWGNGIGVTGGWKRTP